MIPLAIAAVAAAVTWRSTGPVVRGALGLAVVAAALAVELPRDGALLGASIVALVFAATALLAGRVRGARK